MSDEHLPPNYNVCVPKISSRRAVSARRLEIHRRVARTVALRAVGGIDRRVCVRRSSSALLPCKAGV